MKVIINDNDKNNDYDINIDIMMMMIMMMMTIMMMIRMVITMIIMMLTIIMIITMMTDDTSDYDNSHNDNVIMIMMILYSYRTEGVHYMINWLDTITGQICFKPFPDSNVHWANMGPTWGRQDPGGPHVGHVNLAIWVDMVRASFRHNSFMITSILHVS